MKAIRPNPVAVQKVMNTIQNILNIIIGTLTIVSFAFATLLVIAYVSLVYETYDNKFLIFVCQVLHLLIDKSATIDKQFITANANRIKDVLECCISVSVAISSILLSVIAFISLILKKHNLQKSIGIKKYTIPTNDINHEDLEIMKRYFEDADDVIIVSSTFNWLPADYGTSIRNVLENVDKVKLIITGDSKEELTKKLKEKNSKLEQCVVQKELHSAKRFSFVKKSGNTKCVLYRQNVGDQSYIFAFSENINTTLLLDALGCILEECIS